MKVENLPRISLSVRPSLKADLKTIAFSRVVRFSPFRRFDAGVGVVISSSVSEPMTTGVSVPSLRGRFRVELEAGVVATEDGTDDEGVR